MGVPWLLGTEEVKGIPSGGLGFEFWVCTKSFLQTISFDSAQNTHRNPVNHICTRTKTSTQKET